MNSQGPLLNVFRTIVFAVVLPFASPAISQRPPTISPFPPPNSGATFGSSGFFGWAGGVIMQGSVDFYENPSPNAAKVAMTALSLKTDRNRGLLIAQGAREFRLPLHLGLACPLARFVDRGGQVAYTQPFELTGDVRDNITQGGLIEAKYYRDAFIAKEFYQSKFETLLADADFFEEVDLPKPLSAQIIANLNSALGKGRRIVERTNWYVNTDLQVTYQVSLDTATSSVDIAGVPLRYYWSRASDRSAVIDSVKAMSEVWVPVLTNISDPGTKTTQYDIAVLYRVAAIFRQFKRSNADDFSRFVREIC